MTRSHLYAKMPQLGKTHGVKMGKMQFYAIVLTKPDTKPFVTVRLLTTQTKITMSRLDLVSEFFQGQSHSHTVSSARQSYKVLVASIQQIARRDKP